MIEVTLGNNYSHHQHHKYVNTQYQEIIKNAKKKQTVWGE